MGCAEGISPSFENCYLCALMRTTTVNIAFFPLPLLLVQLQPPTLGLWLGLGVLLVLLCGSAFMSASESAFFSLSPSELETMEREQEGTSGYRLALRMLAHPDRLLASILIMNNAVNVGIVLLGDYVVTGLVRFEDAGATEFLVKVVLITFLLLLFGEIFPKNIGLVFALPYVRFAGRSIHFFYRMTSPLAGPLSRMVSSMHQRFAAPPNLSMDELGHALDITQGKLSDDGGILRRIVHFGEIEASEIMRPRIDVVAIDVEGDFESVKALITSSGYSRIPAYEGTLDTVVGILYVKDLLPYLDAPAGFNWVQLIRSAYYVPENRPINSLFSDFQHRRIHMAVVVDEYGGTSGIITLEDVMEEVFGDIVDESDAEAKLYTQLGEGVYRIDAKMQLNDLSKLLGLEDDDIFQDVRGEAETLGGLVLEVLGRFPEVGQTLKVAGLTLTVEQMGKRRIEYIKVERGA